MENLQRVTSLPKNMPTQMPLPKDLQGAQKLKWAPFAGRNLSYFFTYMHLRETYGKLYEKLIGIRFTFLFVEGNANKWQMYRASSESERLETFVYEKTKDAAYVRDILQRSGNGFEKYRQYAEQKRGKNYAGANTKELADALRTECHIYLNMLVGVSCAIIFASALARRLQETVPEQAVAQMALPLHMTLPLEEEIAFWKMVAQLQKEKIKKIHDVEKPPSPLKSAIQAHFDAYCWMDAYENEPTWKMDDLVSRINEALEKDGEQKVHGLQARHDANEKLVHDTAKKYGVSKQQLAQFRLAMYYRILGESLVGLANHASAPLFSAIAKKLLLPRNQIKWFSDEELLGALDGTLQPDELLSRLPERRKHYVIALGEKQVHAFQGQEAQAFLDQLDIENPVVVDVKEVKGVSAYPGKVTGYARVVQHAGQLDKVKTGDIL